MTRHVASISGALAAAAYLGLVQGAVAQDTPVWSGWYIGGTVQGYSASLTEDETVSSTGALNGVFSYSGDGLAAGLLTGRNWQRDDLVYGFEVSASTGQSVTADINTPDVIFAYDAGLMLGLVGRAGYLVRPDTLVFASAGLSMGNLDYDWTVFGQTESGQVWSQGYSLGIGVERQFGEGNALRLGLDYVSRDSDDFSTPTILPGLTYSNDLDQVAVSIGFIHYFGD
jgi:hypothetical protein